MIDKAVDWAAVQAELSTIQSQLEPLNVHAEICGNWIWLSSSTEKHDKFLKNLGFRYSKNKEKWFYVPSSLPEAEKKDDKEDDKEDDREYTMDDIRKRHGSRIFKKMENSSHEVNRHAYRKTNRPESNTINTIFFKLFMLFASVYR